jgi:hypothetical protein
MDREAITAHLKSHTYQTMLAEWDLRNQLLTRVYTGFFHAVAGVNYPDSDYVPVKLKTSWA